MCNFFSVLAVLTLSTSGSMASTDPCTGAIQIGNSKRTITYDAGMCGGQQCDNYITEGLWYRLDGQSTGVRMPETCVPAWHCGTYAPIWLNGAHPTAQYPGPTLIPICAQFMVNGDCCGWRSSMYVKRCLDPANNEYFVYQLQVPPFCDMAYCAGSGVNCGSTGAWNAVLNNCTSPQFPPLNGGVTLTLINPSDTKPVIDNNGNPFNATRFGVNCTFTYQNGVQKVDDGARFDVLFLADGTLVSKTTLTSMTTTVVSLDELVLAGHLDHNLICSVSSYWTAPYPTRNAYSNSNSIYFGINVTDINGNIINSLSIQDGQSATIKIQPTFPITTADCFNLAPETPCNPNYQFQIYSNNIYLSNCTFQLSPTTPSTSIVLSPIPEPYTVFGTFPLKFTAGNTVQTESSIFSSYASNTIQVTTTKLPANQNWITCTSSGDPHILGFNSSYTYHLAYPGDFIMFEEPSKNITIQAKTFECGSAGPVYCHCGVIAREGNNIVGVDSCDLSKPPVVTRYLLDTTNPGVTVVNQNGWYTITLLSGLQINHAFGSLSITYINGGNYDGLCTKTFLYNVVCAPTNFVYCPWWGTCTQDCLPYSVTGSNSFFNIGPSTPASSLCLGSPAKRPSCDCQSGASSSCQNVLAQSILLPVLHTCPASSSRRRRDTTTDSDAPQAQYPSVPSNAASSQQNYTQQQAMNACNAGLSSSTSFIYCTNTVQVNTSFVVESCVLDVLATSDIITYPAALASQFEILCHQAIQNPNNPGNRTQQQQQFNQLVCPNQCNGKGSCQNGTCVCQIGFMGVDCSIMQGAIPSILSAVFDVCDIRRDNCSTIYLYAANASNGVTCRIRPITGLTYYDKSPTVNGGSVTCSLQRAPVNTDGSSFSTTNYTVFLSLSNDQQMYSNEQAFTVYDGLCVSCNTSATNCQYLENTCNICSRCYAAQDQFNSTANFVCDPSRCPTRWSSGTSRFCSDGTYVPCTSSQVSVTGLVLLLSYILFCASKRQ